MKKQKPSTQISYLFRSLSQPARIEILLAIGAGEACVCHLEAMLKMRQAYISQHLMALRQAGILDARREGRFVFYRLADPQVLDFIRMSAQAAGIPADQLVIATGERPHSGCCCPQCAPVAVDSLIQLNLAETGN